MTTAFNAQFVDAHFQEASDLLEALFDFSPEDVFLEIRPLPGDSDRGIVQRFHLIQHLRKRGFAQVVPTEWDGAANIYYGYCHSVP